MTDVFERIRSTSDALLQVTTSLEHKTLRGTENWDLDKTLHQRIEKEQKHSRWLDYQIEQLERALSEKNLTAIGIAQESLDGKKIELKKKKEALFDSTVDQEQLSLIISRLEVSQLLVESVFLNSPQNRTIGLSKKTELNELVDLRDEASLELAELVKDLSDVRKRHEQLKKTNAESLAANREVWANVQSKESHRKAEKLQEDEIANSEDRTKLLQAKQLNHTLRNVLLCLITGSGVDWFADESFRELVLSLEGPVGFTQ